jgi:hypothetical protein
LASRIFILVFIRLVDEIAFTETAVRQTSRMSTTWAGRSSSGPYHRRGSPRPGSNSGHSAK